MKERPSASLSLDLDDLWTYLKIRNDASWTTRPSFLETVVPRALEFLRRHGLRITFFIVGEDAARPENAKLMRAIADGGHDIGNHSHAHEPWFHRQPEREIVAEIRRAHAAIVTATGRTPRGFRGPGDSFSPAVLGALATQGYLYDASTLPSLLGPLARLYYFRQARLDAAERAKRRSLFGSFADGLRPLRPYMWRDGAARLLEIPVTTCPLLRTPFHPSYLIYVARFSPAVARLYARTGFTLCHAFAIEPSFLLHPLDFIGAGEVKSLAFFPGMDLGIDQKLAVLESTIAELKRHHDIVAMDEHAAAILKNGGLREIPTTTLQAQPAQSLS
jgi:peptidoglycan/xylan/chitin deacetylase (PgdA/CDA1 family)